MDQITLVATTQFGLEPLLQHELAALGFTQPLVSNGRVTFEAAPADIPRLAIWLRSADRLMLQMAEFRAHNFDQLFEESKAVPWERLITQDGRFTVNAKSMKSELRSVRSCQSIVKKAVVERLKEGYQTEWFEETGPEFTIHATLLRNVATLLVDIAGGSLHKRGYREYAGEAPLKETLAVAMVKLSGWRPDLPLLDPMCGSGTILIEAAMMARNIAPGIKREFAAEAWPLIPAAAWTQARESAQAAILPSGGLIISGYDMDEQVIRIARMNADLAGVGDDIQFEHKPLKDLWIDRQYGVMISNPPYGMRLAELQEVNRIYINLHKMFRKKWGWSVCLLTADEKFPDFFKRARADAVQKLYNGQITVYFYQFRGQMPAESEPAS